VLVVVIGPDGHHGQGGAGCRVDPLRPRQGLLVGLGVQERGCALAPALFEALVEGRDQVRVVAAPVAHRGSSPPGLIHVLLRPRSALRRN
jgi:hypothetical protein